MNFLEWATLIMILGMMVIFIPVLIIFWVAISE